MPVRQETPLPTWREMRAETRDRYLRRAMRRANGSVRKAAKLAGVTRTSFYRLLTPALRREFRVAWIKGNDAWKALGD